MILLRGGGGDSAQWLVGRSQTRRLDRAANGNLGDIAPVGEGVFEMREHFGPGWRMYDVQRGDALIVMLGGGAKSTQAADIAAARARTDQLEE